MIVLGRTNTLESHLFKSLAALQIRLQLDAGKWGYRLGVHLHAIPPQQPLL